MKPSLLTMATLPVLLDRLSGSSSAVRLIYRLPNDIILSNQKDGYTVEIINEECQYSGDDYEYIIGDEIFLSRFALNSKGIMDDIVSVINVSNKQADQQLILDRNIAETAQLQTKEDEPSEADINTMLQDHEDAMLTDESDALERLIIGDKLE